MVFGVVGGVITFFVLLGFGVVAFFAKYYKRVVQGKALVINKRGKPEVSFTTAFVLPLFHRAELMDISLKTIEIDRSGQDGLICEDNIRADIRVTFFVRVSKTAEDVLNVAQAIGCDRASHQETLENLFTAKFSEALKTVGKNMEFVHLYDKRDTFRSEIIKAIGQDLNGYALEDAAIDYLEQTPITKLDNMNILDAEGIRKITELTATQHVHTNLASNNEQKQIRKQDVERAQVILEQDKTEAAAVARQRREVAEIQAREAAQAAEVQAQEKLKAESARIKATEAIQVQEENKARQVEVAQKNRERVVGIEDERSMKDRALEAIARERETELQAIAKEKAVEIEKKDIADVIRQRISVERGQAEEEEAIKRIRVVQEADRLKEAKVITAEADAQESLVKEIKAAEAREQAAKFEALQRLHLAEADLEVADKQAQAKIKLADGIRAEEAAPGLAKAQVREAEAVAHEKYGMADAKVTYETLSAEAKGKEAAAGATEKMGLAEASAAREMGVAEGTAIESRLKGEASGLADKAKSMKALDQASRGHEEFRLQLDKEKTVELAGIKARRMVAEAQARIMGEAFKTANIDIVGGDGAFFDRMIHAISLGKSTDGFVEKSDTVSTLLSDYLDGSANLPADVKDILSRPKLSAGDVQNLTLSAFLAKLATGATDDDQEKISQLLETAKSLGLTQKNT